MTEEKRTDLVLPGIAENSSRRRFLQDTVATAASTLIAAGTAPSAEAVQSSIAASLPGKRPNFLILMCDEDRFPPVYESPQTQAFRKQYLQMQNALRQNRVEFRRHYVASVACSPSRTSIYTGQHPSLHGVTQTSGAAKGSFDPDVFWLDPNSVPTLGNYFRAAGYATYWRGKWHASEADMLIPGTKSPLISYNSKTGAPDPPAEALYTEADRLDRFGFSGWIGPEPHGQSPLNSGSSVPPYQQGRDIGFAQQAVRLIQQLDHDASGAPWFIVASFVNPHDISLWGLFARTGQAGNFDFAFDGTVPDVLFDPVQFEQTQHDDLSKRPKAQASYQESYARWMQPIISFPPTYHKYLPYYYQLQKNVDEQMMKVFQAAQRVAVQGRHDRHLHLRPRRSPRLAFRHASEVVHGVRRGDPRPAHHLQPQALSDAALDPDANEPRRSVADAARPRRPRSGADTSRAHDGPLGRAAVSGP